MKTVLKGVTGLALVAGLMAAPAAAQQKSWGFGIHAGRLNSGSLAENGNTQLELDNDWTIGGNLEWWFGGRRVGLRLDAARTDQPFQIETDVAGGRSDQIRTELDQFGTVDTWFADADLMLRLLNPSVDRRFSPFLSLGGGIIRWDHEGENQDLQIPEADVQIYGEDQTEGAVAGGIGADFFIGQSVALRMELKDYWNPNSPYIMLSRMNDVEGTAGSRHHGGAHNIIYRAGLQFMFGGARVEEPGFIAAAPAPAPAPVVTPPPPPPAPTTESVAMCVVDANGRLQVVNATRNLSNRQIFVTRNGQQVAFSTAYPTTQPQYIRGAPWYVASRPLILDLDADDMGGDVDDEIDDAIENSDNLPANRVEFVNFGSTQPLPMGDVLYVGSMDGTPLYAKRTDIGGLLPDLESRLRVSTDLDDVLDDEAFADRFVNEIETFYMAVEPGSTNCVFQPLSSTRVVRRTRG